MIQTQKKQASLSNDKDDDDDAICKRTRARCSLASSTLDDLEAFLHDEDEDISNVDDDDEEEQEEYRKFVAATVSHSGGDAELHDDDDDDEDKDVDFEIQLEQALETDDDEETSTPRPVSRRKRRVNLSNDSRLLRPLVPIFPITQPAMRFYTTVSSQGTPVINRVFSEAQIRELHCLVHDHLQLLIQVYSLCAFDHSKQQIGTQVQGLISEMMLQEQQRPSRFLGSVSSVLDLAGRYLADVCSAVQEYRKRQVESGFDSMFERVPLFGSGDKDPIGGVHEDIAELAKVFLPLFKVSLFPQKPPGGSNKRSLFTCAEDELLALGIMEYNSDWKAIQQRFLPCKSEHQIFIRKKNKGASRAFENPVKAVLRMKSSKKNNEAYLHEGFVEEERPSLLYSATSMHSYENDRIAPCVFPLGMRKPHKKSVVRLASDLPPVSLPSSASVILPSVFAKNQCSTTSIIKGGMSGRENLSTAEIVNSSEKNDPGLVMHSLLFRTSEQGQIATCNTRGSSCSSSFLSGIQPQLLSLFNNNPRQIDHSAALGDSCFHPLLRRSEYEMSRRENAKLCELEDTPGAGDKACIPVAGCNDGSQAPGSTATSRCIDEMGDQSNLGIVMEHEELSDSDQDMMGEENVEFECEEMTDSDREDDSECEGNSR